MANIFCVIADETKDLAQYLTDIGDRGHKLVVCICSLEKVIHLYTGENIADFAHVLLIDGGLIVDDESEKLARQLVESFRAHAPEALVLEWSASPLGLCDIWQEKQVTPEGVLGLMKYISEITA